MTTSRKELEQVARAMMLRNERRAADPMWNFEPSLKQRAFIDAVLGEQIGDIRSAPKYFHNYLFAGNRFGKCLPLDERVLMADGTWKLLCDVMVGDWVIGHNLATSEGRPVQVSAVHRSGTQEVFETTFSDGGTIRCTSNHEIPGYLNAKKKECKKHLLSEYMKCNLDKVPSRPRFLSPDITHFLPHEQTLPIHPYVLGVLLGDGSFSHGIQLTSADPTIVDRVMSHLPGLILRKIKEIQYRIVAMQHDEKGYCINPLVTALKDLNLYSKSGVDKFIPQQYLSASYYERKQLLAGLIDTDGSKYEFTNKSEQLVQGFCFLVRSLGGRATYKLIEKTCTTTGARGTYYRAYWRLNYPLALELQHKQVAPTKRACNYSNRIVRSITSIGHHETGCITVDHPDHTFIAGDWVVVGNSILGAYCVAQLARTSPTYGWVVTVSNNLSNSVIQPKIFDNGMFLGDYPPFIPEREIDGWNTTRQVLSLKNGSIIEFKNCKADRETFQGAGLDWVLFDEEPDYSIFSETAMRSRAGVNLRVFVTATLLPSEGEVGGVSWMYDKFIVPWKEDPSKCAYQIFQGKMYDNTHLTPETIKYYESLYPKGSLEWRIRMNGELIPGLGGSRAYTSFESVLHTTKRSKDDSIHTSLPPLQLSLPLCLCFDFNVNPMSLLIGQRHGTCFVVYKECLMESGSIPRIIDWFKTEYPNLFEGTSFKPQTHPSELWVYGDATGSHRQSGVGESNYVLIMRELASYPTPVRLKVPTVNPRVPDRINAVNVACKDENGRINILIAPHCKELILDMEGVLRNADGSIKKTSDPTNPYTKRTHLSDALGYWISTEAPILLNPSKPKAVRTPGSGFKMKQIRYGR